MPSEIFPLKNKAHHIWSTRAPCNSLHPSYEGGRDDAWAGRAAEGLVHFPGGRQSIPKEQCPTASRGRHKPHPHHHYRRAHRAHQQHRAACENAGTATGTGSRLHRQQPGRKWWGGLRHLLCTLTTVVLSELREGGTGTVGCFCNLEG